MFDENASFLLFFFQPPPSTAPAPTGKKKAQYEESHAPPTGMWEIKA
jgi:hypothetical protein